MRTEKQRVQSQNSKARAFHVPATLTEEEWLKTIADFDGMCAYCQVEPFTIMEHFLPIEVAGTTDDNCIPACRFCNTKKSDATGDMLVERFSGEVIKRIQKYLSDHEKPAPLTTVAVEKVKRKYRRKLPPIVTVYVAISEAHAEKLRSEGKKVEWRH